MNFSPRLVNVTVTLMRNNNVVSSDILSGIQNYSSRETECTSSCRKKYEINETTVVLHEFKKLKRTVWLNHGGAPDHVRVRTTAACIAASTGFRLSVRRYNKSLACQRWGNEGSTHYE